MTTERVAGNYEKKSNLNMNVNYYQITFSSSKEKFFVSFLIFLFSQSVYLHNFIQSENKLTI